ncbi:tRNA threonylcarbamoyladenosine biosynthesis protein TsaB [secondary endosymbiont of Trabutina mannipara]|uniref:tRNA threonylcarbamoyladenosine biosynthesis protein TsaB n=1 Tax=secondary endosymbiont of Trabutina mannipara TaxID=1835721 RepID=A0A1C3L3R4_9ENTR|nr:tRNA (adenosine(37)-N6)-threonylcarbamoyltransferase complex dimerization subunit type 1 TsaB [secondary endosymbiont of Trabutina mannipara]SBT81904.1 tRNA threonylcarbamoyladenosine biosynthesis protein TsaB [secondary endosymbiont of Trabutina mannipara]
MPTRILAIDTATEACSAAIMLDNDILLKKFTIAPKEHTQLILPMVDSLLSEAGITLSNLDALAFSCGPGNFTGVRISIGIAQGLALGADLPLIGISTLAILAEGAWRNTGANQVLTAINAHMQKVYWAPYQRQGPGIWIGEEHEVIVETRALDTIIADFIGCWAIAGTGWQNNSAFVNYEHLQLINGKILLPNAQDILPLALHKYYHGNMKPIGLVKQNYLHNEVLWKNFQKNRKVK